MKPKPAELDLDALKEAFYAQPTHAGLRTLQTLHDEAQLLVWRTLKELRKFIMAKDDQVLRSAACLCALYTHLSCRKHHSLTVLYRTCSVKTN